MTPEIEAEVRAIIELQKQIEALKAKISSRLNAVKEQGSCYSYYVIDGEIWQLVRWSELRDPMQSSVQSLVPQVHRKSELIFCHCAC